MSLDIPKLDPKWKAIAQAELAKLKWYPRVPKDLAANFHYRKAVLKRAEDDLDFQATLMQACSEDILFYINTFYFTHNAKDPEPSPCKPFVTWEFQDETIALLKYAIENQLDVAIPKSREMGATWMVLAVYEWFWRFKPLRSFLMASRKEELVDGSGDYKSLMERFDFIHDYMPHWLRANEDRKHRHMGNLDNHTAINGETTNDDLSRSERHTGLFGDEFAAVEAPKALQIVTGTRDAAGSRFWVSTYKGAAHPFYDLANKTEGIMVIPLHWTLHPIKTIGLRYDVDGNPRSPWYDRECAKAIHPMEIAQELDMNPMASDSVYFDPAKLDQIKSRDVRPPLLEGVLDYDRTPIKPTAFLPTKGGPLKAWFHLDAEGKPPKSVYVIGCDVAEGSSLSDAGLASNSVLVVGDARTGAKVAEYAAGRVEPHVLAEIAVAMARWFRDENGGVAYMIWEANGPGGSFGATVISLGFGFFYNRRDVTAIDQKVSKKPGFWNQGVARERLFREYKQALENGKYLNPSHDAIQEARFYKYAPDGRIWHSKALSSSDPATAKDNHGDRVIADAVCWWAMRDRPTSQQEEKQEAPVGSRAWRDKRHKNADAGLSYDDVLGQEPGESADTTLVAA